MSKNKKIGIVLIDDSFIDRTIVRKNMELFYSDIPFSAFPSAKEALTSIVSDPPLPETDHCVILLDIYMPEMNGFAFADEYAMLDEETKSRYTIVMLSSSIDGGDMENVERREVIAKFISKPLNESVLKSVLEDTIHMISGNED